MQLDKNKTELANFIFEIKNIIFIRLILLDTTMRLIIF